MKKIEILSFQNYESINSIMNTTMNTINEQDASILAKIRMFGIFTPDERVSHTVSRFDAAALKDEDSDSIKTQYMTICSLAFLFGFGKDCVRDKYNRLIPIDLAAQNQRNILKNNGAYSPRLVSEITDRVYENLNKLEDNEMISSDEKWELTNKYQDQLAHDDLILEEPEIGTCCCCGGPCNPCSQTCGACPRNGRLMAWALDHQT